MVRVVSEMKAGLIRLASDALGTKPKCEYCGTTDPESDIKGITESAYWAELCECCRESTGAEA